MRIYNKTEETIQLEPGEYITSHKINKRNGTLQSVEIKAIPEGFDKNHSSDKEEAYEDRNLSVLAFLKTIHLYNKDIEGVEADLISQGLLADMDKSLEAEIGWREAPNFDDEWVYVWIDSEYGQKSWALPRMTVESLDWLEEKEIEYDGHTREDKNQRLKEFIGVE